MIEKINLFIMPWVNKKRFCKLNDISYKNNINPNKYTVIHLKVNIAMMVASSFLHTTHPWNMYDSTSLVHKRYKNPTSNTLQFEHFMNTF